MTRWTRRSRRQAPFQIVDDFVAGHGVLPFVHFHMDAGEALAGAVIMNHQVVKSQNFRVRADQIFDFFLQFRTGGLPQQGRDRFFCQVHAAVENEQRHQKAHDAVGLEAGDGLDAPGQQHGGSGDHVVAAVRRRGHQGLGADEFPQSPVEKVHPQLYADGPGQHQDKGQRKFNGRGVEDFLKAGPGQLEADDDDQRSHGQPGKVFIPAWP